MHMNSTLLPAPVSKHLRLCAAVGVIALLHGGVWADAGGVRQSPINIEARGVVRAEQAAITATYAPAASLSVVNTWNPTGSVPKEFGSIKANVGTASYIMVGAQQYNLLQFHFHTPSEHQVNGKDAPMEVHFVHLREGALPCDRPQDALLVIGARIKVGVTKFKADSAAGELDKLFGAKVALPVDSTAGALPIANFNLNKVLPSLADSWRYSGSLTAPASFGNCTEPEGSVAEQLESEVFPENVSWVVLTRDIEMSKAQIDRFKALFEEGNTRAVQPINARRVTRDTAR